MYRDYDTADCLVTYDTDDLIYNRFDLIYRKDYERFTYNCETGKYLIDAHYEGQKALLNTWGKRFPQQIAEAVVEDVFQGHPEIRYVEFNRAGNDYQGMLTRKNDIRIPIPAAATELMARLKPKHRYNLKRAKRLLEEACGELAAVIYEGRIPDEIINLYFSWKAATHGTSYGMSPAMYLKKYHVTHAMALWAGETIVGIAFYCMVNDIVYLENFSYDMRLEKLSAGYLTYVMVLEELVKKQCRFLYLGGGEYAYKKHFGAEENPVYSGAVYSGRVFEELNDFFLKNNIKKIAIYGLGVCGREFLKVKDRLDLELVYGIDREEKEMAEIPVYTLEGELSEVDAVLITLYSHNSEIEKFLNEKSFRFFYWDDLAKFGV